jgi:hypothetical protein
LDSPQTYEASSSEYKNSPLNANEFFSVPFLFHNLSQGVAAEQVLQAILAAKCATKGYGRSLPVCEPKWGGVKAICILARARPRVFD